MAEPHVGPLTGFDMQLGPAVFDLSRDPKILDLVESIIGPEPPTLGDRQQRILSSR